MHYLSGDKVHGDTYNSIVSKFFKRFSKIHAPSYGPGLHLNVFNV